MTISEIIKKRLTDLEMTQTELASALGTTRQNFSNKLNRDNFTAKELSQIADILRLEIILKDSDSESKYTLKY